MQHLCYLSFALLSYWYTFQTLLVNIIGTCTWLQLQSLFCGTNDECPNHMSYCDAMFSTFDKSLDDRIELDVLYTRLDRLWRFWIRFMVRILHGILISTRSPNYSPLLHHNYSPPLRSLPHYNYSPLLRSFHHHYICPKRLWRWRTQMLVSKSASWHHGHLI